MPGGINYSKARKAAIKYQQKSAARKMIRRTYRLRIGKYPSIHKFKEMCQLADIGAAAGSTYGAGVITFKLSDLTNVPSLRNLFDLYKITYVKLKLIPQFTEVPTQGSTIASQFLPTIAIAPNRDVYIGQPGSMADILNDDGCKVYQCNRQINLNLKMPKPSLSTYNEDQSVKDLIPIQGSLLTNFWLSTGGNAAKIDQENVPHFGFRFYIDNNNAAGQSVTFKVYATYYLSFKEQD